MTRLSIHLIGTGAVLAFVLIFHVAPWAWKAVMG